MRIGELAGQLGINAKTIRFYESIGLLPQPHRTPAGYRQYNGDAADRITFIKTAQRLGMSLDDIREILAFRDRGEPPCGYVRGVLAAQLDGIDRHIDELSRLRRQLVDLQAVAELLPDAADPGCYCGIIQHAAAAPAHPPAAAPKRQQPSNDQHQEETAMRTVTIHVAEIHCESCEAAIRRGLGQLDGVHYVQAAAATDTVTVVFDQHAIDEADLRARLTDIGYDPA